MKKLHQTLCFSAFAALAFFAGNGCKTDPINCKDDKVGDIFFDQKTVDFLPLDGKKALIFKDSSGLELRFLCPTPTIQRIGLNVEKLCESTQSLSAKHKQVWADLKELKFAHSSSAAPGEFELRAQTGNAILDDEGHTAFFDLFSAAFFDGKAGSEIIFLVSERDAKPADLAEIRSVQKFRTIADTTFLGKNFKDVLAGGLISGSDAKSKTAFFYQKNVGPVAFSLDDGRLFVLDRVE